MKIKLTNEQIRQALEIPSPSFPKYVRQIINVANQNAQGIDGYIGNMPVSIKPETYKIKKSLSEEISAKLIYYKKVKNGIEVDYGEVFD